MIQVFLSDILRKFINLSGQHVLIPFYHAVYDKSPEFIGNLYAPRSIENFTKDLEVLLEFYQPISLIELIEISKSKKKITQNYFHLTFDDGLSNFYEVVAPILKKKNIPATIFLNSNFVDNKELFFRYKASLLIHHYHHASDNVKNIYKNFFNFKKLNKKDIQNKLLTINYKNRYLLDELASKIDFSFEKFLKNGKPFLTSSQIFELKNQGFTFGAHSIDHPYYFELTLEKQVYQTEYSMNWVARKFGLNYKAFSFPFSEHRVLENYYSEIQKKKMLDISFGSSGLKLDRIENNYQRISFEIKSKNMKRYLLLAYLKFFVKIILKKKYIYRTKL